MTDDGLSLEGSRQLSQQLLTGRLVPGGGALRLAGAATLKDGHCDGLFQLEARYWLVLSISHWSNRISAIFSGLLQLLLRGKFLES